MDNKISVLIADDHQLFRNGMALALKKHSLVSKIHHATNGVEVMTLLEKQNFDIIFMDIQMPKMDGITATKMVREKYPNAKIIALSFFNDRVSILNMVKAGAIGYLTKNATPKEIGKAIRNISVGKNYYSLDAENYIMNKPMKNEVISKAFRTKDDLTIRELEVIKLIIRCNTSKEISDNMSISLKTVESHRTNIYAKLKIAHLIELIYFAIDNGLIQGTSII